MYTKYGMNTTKFFYGGHSLGGSSITSWVHQNSQDAEGAFAWGSYVSLSITDPAKNYKVPFLTLGAELDGWMARITRISESFDQMKSSSLGYDISKYRYPLVVVPGLNHA